MKYKVISLSVVVIVNQDSSVAAFTGSYYSYCLHIQHVFQGPCLMEALDLGGIAKVIIVCEGGARPGSRQSKVSKSLLISKKKNGSTGSRGSKS
jgi:hypothetical protein